MCLGPGDQYSSARPREEDAGVLEDQRGCWVAGVGCSDWVSGLSLIRLGSQENGSVRSISLEGFAYEATRGVLWNPEV